MGVRRAPLAHPLLPPPRPGRQAWSVRPRGRVPYRASSSPVGARPRLGRGRPRGGSGADGGGAGPRAHLPGAAGSRRLRGPTSAPPPPRSRPAVCLRGDEDGGGGDGPARAAEDGQPVSAETGSTPGGGSAWPALLLGPQSLRSHFRPNRPFLPISTLSLSSPAFPAEAMEDEERKKKLEAGKAKVTAGGCRARGGRRWLGRGGWGPGKRRWSSRGALPGSEGLQGLHFSLALFSNQKAWCYYLAHDTSRNDWVVWLLSRERSKASFLLCCYKLVFIASKSRTFHFF